MKPLFSILHSTARPQKWRAAYDAWLSKAEHPYDVEYVLCVDERWGFGPRDIDRRAWGIRTMDKLVWNEGPKTAVSGWNTAAAASTGSILLVVADDFFPCEHWDEALRESIARGLETREMWVIEIGKHDFAVHVHDGTPADQTAHMCHAFMSRARYEHQGGYVYYPDYEGVFCDNDFTAHARQDGVVIEATHLLFKHDHPGYRGGELDAAFWHHNKTEDYAFGRALYERRKAECFGHPELVGKVNPPVDVNEPREAQRIALCYPGETFDVSWVAAAFRLNAHLANRGFDVAIHMAHTTNVYVTRADLLEAIREQKPAPDLILWIDDDNILEPGQFDRLLADLKSRPDADGVTGWCWIQDQGIGKMYPSCGEFSINGLKLVPFSGQTFPQERELRPCEWTGFPAFLWRYSAVEKAGGRPFLPLLDPGLRYGLSGEDHAFCKVAQDAGAVFLVDPQVRVAHLKFRAIEPEWVVESGASDPVIVGMLRVKNESRWIARSVKSLFQVCKAVYVMDDRSTDSTAQIARECGARVFQTPFDGEINESRDKTWLLERIREEEKPDWILAIDGDEEIEPRAKGPIFAACRQNGVNCFAFPFYHLWDRPDQVRIDRWYSSFTRRGLFRPLPGATFESIYEQAGVSVHSGLHVSNAPGGAQTLYRVLPVHLIHYGFMLQADRIRKWKWYNSIDPENELEDRYRHCVQGDVPEVPADAILRHAGPLQLAPLPKELVPDLPAESLVPREMAMT